MTLFLRKVGARKATALVAACLLFAVMGSIVPAQAAAPSDPNAQREEVRQKRAAVAGQLDALHASSAEVNAALDSLEANVRGAQAQALDAQREATAAQAEADQAQRDADATQARIDSLRDQVAQASIDAYVHPPGDQVMDVFHEQDATKAVTKSALRDAANGSKLDVVDEFRTAQHELELKRDAAAQAQAKASERARAMQEKVAGLAAARDQQAQVVNQVDARINAALTESDALASLDKTLSNQIAADQASVIAKLNAQRDSGSTGGGGGGG
ncbi:MAG: hypothetical protein WCK41_11555, partial [Actinomycetes bacterium]